MNVNYAIYRISDGKIRSFKVGLLELIDSGLRDGEGYYINCDQSATHVINNEPVTIPPELTPEQIKSTLVEAVQKHLDFVARTRNYDGILSLCSYALSTKNKFKGEGEAGLAWRDDCWEYCYQVLADVQNELRTIPTSEELVAELPEIVW